MSLIAVFAPLFVQVALTFGLLLWMGFLRVRLVNTRAVAIRDIALGEPNWPKQATQVANAYSNQFELPVLFYLVMVLAFFTANATTGLVILAWAFVATRLLHALIQVTTNNVPRRAIAFTAGLVVLVAMWVLLLGHIVLHEVATGPLVIPGEAG